MTISASDAERPRRSGRTPLAAPAIVWVQHEVGIQILHEVAEWCGRASVPFLAVKGIATSRILYADVAERPIGDVDIRIRPGDVRAFEGVARSAGWRCVRVLRSYGSSIYDFGSLSLDVESTVGPPGLCGLEVAAMLERAEQPLLAPGEGGRARFSVPEIHDHALLLAVNVFKDKVCAATPWALSDLERVVVHPSFRPEVFLERVERARSTTLVFVVAAWMESVRGDAAWGEIRRDLERRGRVRSSYARRFRAGMRHPEHASVSLRLLARVASDSRSMRARAVAGAAACFIELPLRKLGARS